MEFLSGTAGQTFALYAALTGACVFLGRAIRMRDSGDAGLSVEAFLAPLGLAALAVSFDGDAPPAWRLLAGALFLSGLAILAIVPPRRTGRTSPGFRVGATLAVFGIAIALISAFLPLSASPNLPT